MEHSTVGPVRCVGPAVKFSLAENRVRGPPPTLGQHRWSTVPCPHCTALYSGSVLRELLGYSAEQVAELARAGVILGVTEDTE